VTFVFDCLITLHLSIVVLCLYNMVLIYEVSSLCCYSVDEGKGMYMRQFFGSVSGSISMSMGLPMSMSMSMTMSPSVLMSYSMSMSMGIVAPVSPHVLYVPSFPSTASETEHPTVSSYEPSSVGLDSSKVTEVPSVLLLSRAPSVPVSVSMVTSSSVTQESVPNDDNIKIGASEMSVNSMGGIKSPFSDGSDGLLPSASLPSDSSSSFFRDVLLPILVTLMVVSGMIVMLVAYDKKMNGNVL
jgi:hypothetical protein